MTVDLLGFPTFSDGISSAWACIYSLNLSKIISAVCAWYYCCVLAKPSS